jgi:hypothetical protein
MSEETKRPDLCHSKEYRVRYHGHSVLVSTRRDDLCGACGRKVGDGIKRTNRHHWRYAYAWKTVRANPELALENTVEYCFKCHPIADAVRLLTSVKNCSDVASVVHTAPDEIQTKFNKIVNAVSFGGAPKK